ncbi:hypothetical protein L0U85_08800 [Glycomyces sp. L485]|uniref:hypothetical protein n=1 Tax=Glycomyces sp. L485 TaxID=2909235 RepID=UPI001F4A7BA9|nr:hypothetical protein [Glycomyces sp. L485]MCH7230946.1 hypothetical protein [Glycomyces sp. L485]
MSDGRGSSTIQQFAVRSRRVVFLVGSALVVGGILAILSGRIGLGVALLVLAFLAVLARGLMTVMRGWRALAERERAQAPRVPVRGADNPAPVDQVATALVAMNGDALPYRIDATRSRDGVRVEVRWKHEEMRWQTLFVRGSRAYAWCMKVDLDPSTGRYKFIEHSGQASFNAAAGPTGAAAYGKWSWQKGKTFGTRSGTFVEAADGQVHVTVPAGPRTSWEGAVMIKPADAKIPVFTVLRNHGWRPRWDWFGARMFEK